MIEHVATQLIDGDPDDEWWYVCRSDGSRRAWGARDTDERCKGERR
jgi:hypothetical protein